MKNSGVNDFGTVDPDGDRFEFHYGTGSEALCVLETVVQTERGPKRTELAAVPASLWRKVSVRAVRELAEGMGESERTKKTPTLQTGSNRLSPLVGREFAVLLWALIEDDACERIEAILHGWRELAREERWWLFAKASAPGQRKGAGWRRALFDALSEPADTRVIQETTAEKKSPSTSSDTSPSCRKKPEKITSRLKRNRELRAQPLALKRKKPGKVASPQKAATTKHHK